MVTLAVERQVVKGAGLDVFGLGDMGGLRWSGEKRFRRDVAWLTSSPVMAEVNRYRSAHQEPD